MSDKVNIVCRHCGKTVRNDMYCSNCGMAISSSKIDLLSPMQRKILEAVNDYKPTPKNAGISVAEVARTIEHKNDSVRATMYSLLSHGYVTRIDRGAYLLTQKGKVYLESANTIRASARTAKPPKVSVPAV